MKDSTTLRAGWVSFAVVFVLMGRFLVFPAGGPAFRVLCEGWGFLPRPVLGRNLDFRSGVIR